MYKDNLKVKADNIFRNVGLNHICKYLNEFLATNYPTEGHRALIKDLFNLFPEFIKTEVVYRAVKEKDFPRALRNKFVSGCQTKEDTLSFVKKRYDKGYKYIMISNYPIDYFDLWEFINYINSQYGMIITTRYQDEKEILFNLKKGTDWYEIIKINSDEL